MEYIKGKIIEKNKRYIILECNYIGYKIYLNNVDHFNEDKIYQIYIYKKYSFINSTITISLYGFLSLDEKNMFEEIISINGIGPKNAMNILKINFNDLINNIKSKNYNFFIIENKINKKITDLFLRNIKLNEKYKENILNNEEIKNKNELIESLEYLGFKKNEINKIIFDLDFKESLDDLIELSIKKIIKYKENNYV